MVTLGCSKNLVDSEVLVSQLRHSDIDAGHSEGGIDANIIVVNTCGFIDRAKEESINTILLYAEHKERGHIDKLFVTGCLSQRYKDDLEAEIPQVDGFFGTLDMPALLERFNVDYRHDLIGERAISTPQHFAYLKISEGCNRTCSFCAIPLMRGTHVSRTIESLVEEASNLARNGVKELILIAQELTYYGLDIYKKRMLPELLKALNAVEGIEWIRLHYAYPSKFPMEILDAMNEYEKVCKYLDIPLQHASDPVLKAMKRQVTAEEQRQLIKAIRAKVPDIAIRTTMLIGFPGETEEDFEAVCDFVREMEFDRLGVFAYSHEENTAAHDLEDNIPAEEKERRVQILMGIQQDISYRKNDARIGKSYKVLIDRKEGQYFVGRTEFDSPEVDNEVLIPAKGKYLRVGDFAQILVEDATDFDLIGKVLK